MLFYLAVLAVAVSPPAEPRPIFSYEDYPVEALRNRWEGSVVADVAIDERGRPTDCRIFKSSGHSTLDAVTCKLILERARFEAAKDSSGRPRKSNFRTPAIAWKIR